MKFALVAAAGLAAVGALSPSRHAPASGHPAEPPSRRADRTTLDSVYSASQAMRGDTLYHASCAKCHGAALEGTMNDGGPLTGSMFLGNWSGLTLDQLFDKTYTTMPSDKPQSLPRKDYADILAYMLSKNQLPAGATALPDSMELLREIRIVGTR